MSIVFSKMRLSEAEAAMRQFRNHYELLDDEYKEEKQKTFVITANMTRQYKLMRDELMHKCDELKQECTHKNTQLQNMQNMQNMHKDKEEAFNAQMALKEQQIQEYKLKVDDMSLQFSQMLKQTLHKMSERIVVQDHRHSNDTSNNYKPRIASTTTILNPHSRPDFKQHRDET